MKRIAILGSTGSIGTSALDVARTHPDKVQVVAIAAATNVGAMVKQVLEFRPRAVAMATGDAMDKLIAALGGSPAETSGVGNDGLCEVAIHPDVDIVLCASSGTAALDAVLAAINAGKTIALANKEVLVMAGAIVMAAARRKGVAVLPVDSEHNAIHQCLHGRRDGELRRLILTASGGPFRGRSRAELDRVTAADALKHPTWQMGPKITIDSATLMNKGLEVIEAHWLFGVPSTAIQVVVHPQSIVHSMVELKDGSIIAQMGITDMRLPIQYAFAYPDRWDAPVPFLDLTRLGPLEFHEPARDDFPCLGLAYRALEAERSLPIVLNAANEVAVSSFLEGRLGFTQIPQVIEQAMNAHEPEAAATLADVRRVDRWARMHAAELARELELLDRKSQ
ncbi:MAG TPA: 1-deoxy-D-xylulose-5-phosphate reductoisomerase [Vicinamibacterales bacterium]|nr:1-deoxy-D-xylulose-5-phosphate reductoisomerase [Vicinamibacterales bacterium]